MSNASRHQLDRPPYLPVGTRRGSRITYYVFIFFSLDPRPVIKGAPPRTRMIYRLCRFSLIRWDRLITSCCLLYVPTIRGSNWISFIIIIIITIIIIIIIIIIIRRRFLSPCFFFSLPSLQCMLRRSMLRRFENVEIVDNLI